MKEFPIFLVPKGYKMYTAMVVGRTVELLAETYFPIAKKYAISSSGFTVCLDSEQKVFIYGQIGENGLIDSYKIINFPDMISPISVCIIGNQIVLGGEYSSEVKSAELVVVYNITNGQFSPLEIPYEGLGKCVDDLLIDKDRVIAVDDLAFPKYILQYSFADPNNPILEKTFELPIGGPNGIIYKGTLSDKYIGLYSSYGGQGGSGRSIKIFQKEDYIRHIGVYYWKPWHTPEDEKKREYQWHDIKIMDDLLCIAAGTDGIGLLKINKFDIINAHDTCDKSDSIVYCNPWHKRIIKLLGKPNDNNQLIFIAKSDDKKYEYLVVNKKELTDFGIKYGLLNKRGII